MSFNIIQWHRTKQARFIESFFINLPIPPIVLLETSYSTYEVFDGNQRVHSILNFYKNELILEKMDVLTLLNNSSYFSFLGVLYEFARRN